MPQDDEEARKAQAARWREQIARLTTPAATDEEEASPDAPDHESPRDFIARKSRELDRGKSTPEHRRDKVEEPDQAR
jgi:hypothetical protein